MSYVYQERPPKRPCVPSCQDTGMLADPVIAGHYSVVRRGYVLLW